ncbi:hypothetical protein [Dysgonomonas reticulitermitis]
MQNTNQIQMLSVKELNTILEFQNKKENPMLGTFSEVDIVFVAGLFLQYMQHKKNWTKIPFLYNLTENKHAWHYFKQIKALYDVNHFQIFDNFPQAQIKTSLFSEVFAPPIYITNKSIDYFFGTQNPNARINSLKENYRENFDITDFINKGTRNYKKNIKKFSDYEYEIKDRLNACPPIFTFIFIVASKNLAKKKNESFDKRKDYIEKLWLFTQDYVRGLYELAKNIVEHSGENGRKGEGMITIRAYAENETDETRIFETHVFDYGKNGVVPKLIEYTRDRATGNSVKNEAIKDCYKKDNDFFENNKSYELKDFITPQKGKELQQQTFRHTSHYGINNLYKLITDTLTSKNAESEIFISSNGQIKKDYFPNENTAKDVTIANGTHYYFKIPFVENNFKNITPKPFSHRNSAILGETASLESLAKIKIIPTSLTQLSGIDRTIENSLINITIKDEKITKENVDSIYNQFDKLSNLKDNNKIAINLQDKVSDVSVLLRFLSYLTFEYKQPFIIYNISYKIYKSLLKDNKDFYTSREPSEAYWHNERAMLLFVKIDEKDFYFADILFGKDRDEFLLVNNVVDKTFPNTITLLEKKKNNNQRSINSECLKHLFYPKTNTLYPFDVILKNNDKSLFVSNLTTILQNPLSNRKKDYSNLNEYIDNFDGFRIIDTHFKIGTKIHSEDFYYAKRLFQNSFYTARLAMLLAFQIKENICDTNKKITLVGYEMYSELLLSLTEKFLQDFGLKTNEQEGKIDHFIAQSEDDNFNFLPADIFKQYLSDYKNRLTIIIVPIAATGNTAKKIENEIKEKIYKYEKNEKKESKENAKKLADGYSFFDKRYNVLLAQPESDFETIKKTNPNQTAIIKLPAKWHEIKGCSLCYGIDANGNQVKTKALFETDKSSLTPAFIFENPKGKVLTEDEEKTFDTIEFKNSLKYKKVFRNNNYRIYSIESDNYIVHNISKIRYWLENKVKTTLNLNLTDKVVIVAPCHESNSRFLNLVNEIVFSSSATIIHYQNNVDYDENFKMLNKNYLNNETKLVYVDDSLITGTHFYEVFDLISEDTAFTASIFLKDKSISGIHNQIAKLSNMFFAFANFNQPPTLNLLEQRPLEHERQRYETLSQTALHDVIIENFQQKADSLNPQKLNTEKENTKDKDKELRRLKCFEATHKIYNYFAKNQQEDNYNIESIVSFKEYSSPINIDLFPEYSQEVEKKKAEERKDNPKALLKVLSKYPFILYKPLKEKTFDWLNNWLSEIQEPNTDTFVQMDYDNFQTIKFVLRRAVLLGNYRVLEKDFFQKILCWFIKIDNLKDKHKLSKDIERNLQDFPIYVLRNYVEMIQKNGWVAYHIFKNIKDLEADLLKSIQGAQFLNMLQIESTLVIDDFYEMIKKERRIEWRDIFSKHKTFIRETDEIVNFFNGQTNKNLLESNKYLIVEDTFLKDDKWKKPSTPFINYLWIKQLLLVDCDKNSHFPRDIDYQTKIDAIIEKMKEFFLADKNIQTFFVITDGQHKSYILKDEQNLLNNFCPEFDTTRQIKELSGEIKRLQEKTNLTSDERNDLEKKNAEKEKLDLEKKNHKTQILVDFLNGIKCNTGVTFETTAGYYRNRSKKEIEDEFYENTENQNPEVIKQDLFSNPSPNYELCKWTDAYNRKEINLPFMPNDSKWLYLIRITKRNEHSGKFDTLGMLGFYSTENLYNLPESLLPKQLLMLLRKDMSEFIIKHHKNDEFAELIQQKEKADYQFMLRHGIDEYKTPIKNYFNKIYNLISDKNEESERLKKYYDFELNHLTNKIDLMQKINKFNPSNLNHFDTFNLQKIITTFKDDFKYVLTFERKSLYYLSETDNILDNIELSDSTENKTNLLNTEIDFPVTILEELIFELIYNIRKHVLNVYSNDIKKDKLKIDLDFVTENDILYFKVSNNYCEKPENYFNCIYNNNKLDGLNLINCILKKANIGILKVTKTESSKSLKDKTVNIYVPLKNNLK